MYERILKGKTEEVLRVVKNFGQTVNGIVCSEEKIQYSVDVLEAVLEDREALFRSCQADVRDKLKQEIPEVIDRLLGLGNEIIPVAIRYPDCKSKALFKRALAVCEEGDNRVAPENIIDYCISLEEGDGDEGYNYVQGVIQCFKAVLESYCDKSEWNIEEYDTKEVSGRCNSFLKGLGTINRRAYGLHMTGSDSQAALQTLDRLFDYVDDTNKLEIIDAYVDYEKFEEWSAVAKTAVSFFNSRGQQLVEHGSEHSVCVFIEKYRQLVNQRLYQYMNGAGKRYRSVCDLLLGAYPERRKSIISELWNDKSGWLYEWIKANASKMHKEEKRKIQDVLFGVAKSNEYPIDVYQTLSCLKMGNYKKAVDARNSHFDELVESAELSTIEGLEFVLERIDKASYRTTDGQNDLLNNGWREIDQRTAGNELKRLVKEVIRT
ncbi:MAG TPA: hypothetical protein VMW16_10920 [Sedimentisphaerales bacterium]|nr:hypothetical protein [Sedimentisphaerales bacterium]